MNSEDLRNVLLLAIASATVQDKNRLALSPGYAASDADRRIHRAEDFLTSLAAGVIESDPHLGHALLSFLDVPPLSAEDSAKAAQARQLASSETFSSPAPGTKR